MYRFLFLLCVINIHVYAQKFENLALTPPMGWNSWNCFECEGINEDVIRGIANAMVTSGMKDAGYEYVIIDDCWQVDRDEFGNIVADSIKFPTGIKALVDYVHSKGLKFGIYSCAGTETCQNLPGSRGYEFQDARQYAAWGVDYLKYDWCNSSNQNAQASYTLMSQAIRKAGRPMVFSICEWGLNKPWFWAKEVGHLWRTTGDIRNNWNRPDGKEGKMWGGGVTILLEMQHFLSKYAGPGHWNDPDMLEVGNGALNLIEEKAHFSLWCMLAAPLMAGNDLRNMSKETRDILTNKHVIAINQDPLGKQGDIIYDMPDFEIWVKELSDDNKAICFFNPGNKDLEKMIDWKEANLNIREEFEIIDLWENKNLGTTERPLNAKIPTHGVLLVKLNRIN